MLFYFVCFVLSCFAKVCCKSAFLVCFAYLCFNIGAQHTLQRTRKVVSLSLAYLLAAELSVVRLRKYEYKIKLGENKPRKEEKKKRKRIKLAKFN
jgi:hypothetical protein